MPDIKDADNLTLTFTIGSDTFTIQACDVDGEGYVENVDVIVNGEVFICASITHGGFVVGNPYGYLVSRLWQAAGLIPVKD